MDKELSKYNRINKGTSIAFACFLVLLLVLPIAGMFTFESLRTKAIKEELNAASKSAAVAAAAKLVTLDHKNPPLINQKIAIDTAVKAFRTNTIDQIPLKKAKVESTKNFVPEADRAGIYIQLLDPGSTPPNQPVKLGDRKGRLVHVIGKFSVKPICGTYFGFNEPITIVTNGIAYAPSTHRKAHLSKHVSLTPQPKERF